MNTGILEGIGFTKGEVKVYIALLKIGVSTSGPIIHESDVSASKVYEILEKLKEKGLVTESVKSGVKYFQVTGPERILGLIKDKENNLKKQEEEFKKILPELQQKMASLESEQEARVYVGYDGVKSFYEDLLKKVKKSDEYLAITFHDESLENLSLSLFFQKFHEKRAKMGVNAKIIAYSKDKKVSEEMNFKKTGLYEFRTTNQTLPASQVIFGKMVAFFNWSKVPRVFVMVCEENAEQYKKFFYDVWKKAK